MADRGGVSRNLVRSERLATAVQAWVWEPLQDEGDDSFLEIQPGQVILPRGITLPGAAHAGGGHAGSAAAYAAANLSAGQSGYGLHEIMEEAETIIKDAQAEAERILADAKLKAQNERDRLFEHALEIARRELAEQMPSEDPEVTAAAEELRQAAHALMTGLRQLADERSQRFEQMDKAALEVAMLVAEKVIGDELESKPEHVLRNVRETLGRINANDITVRVHPADVALVKTAVFELQMERGTSMVMVEADDRVDRGGCMIDTEHGSVDARVSSKLARARGLAGD